MKEIKNNLEVLKELNQPEISHFVIDSIIESNTPARVYVNKPENPSRSIIWEGHNIILGGDISQAKEMATDLADNILTDEVREKLYFAKLITPSEDWQDSLIEAFDDCKVKTMDRVLFRHSLEDIPELENDDQQLEIRVIDSEIIDSELEKDGMIEEIKGMWGSIDKFLRDGFGTCGIKDGKVVCWCTGEYFSEDYCGIGIETVEEYQQQGIATLTAAAFLKETKQQGLIPHWDSWKENTPSVKVAEKLGFERVKDYSVVGALVGE